MRKPKFCAVLLILPLLCAACGKQPTAFSPARATGRAFTLTVGERTLTGELTILAYNDIRFTFSAPEGLTFFSCTADETGLATTVDGRADRIDYETLPDDAPMKLLPAALRKAVFENVPFTKTDGRYETAAAVCGTTCFVAFDEAGLLTGARDADGAFSCVFSDPVP